MVLDARWRIYQGDNETLLASGRSQVTEQGAPVPDYDAIVAAMSRALGQASDEIARAIASPRGSRHVARARELTCVASRSLLLLMSGAGGAAVTLADQNDPRLGPLFMQLKAAPDAAAAKPVEAEIWRIWGETANPDSAALFARGVAAMNLGDGRTARAAFDLLVTREPDFAEGWNKRATLLYLLGDDDGSVADIQRTLALEPRHFGALSGLSLIFQRQNRPAQALQSLEAALAVNPLLPGGRARAKELKELTAGDPT